MKLTEEEIKLAKALGELHDNLIRPFGILLRKYESQERKMDSHGTYGFVPALGEEIAANLIKIRKLFPYLDKKPTLLDLGCGIGNIAALAHTLGYVTQGIELDENLAFYGNPYNNIVNKSIFDLQSIKSDVIFVYRPIHHMNTLFAHLKSAVRGETILYSFGVIPPFGEPLWDNPFIVKLS